MRIKILALITITSLLNACLVVTVNNSDNKKQDPPKTDFPPKPGPHHKCLALSEGTWDVTTKFVAMPNQPESKGVDTSKLTCNGLWLVTEHKSLSKDFPYLGHGFFGYDPHKKKHVGAWISSMQNFIDLPEGECENSCKKVTYWSEFKDPMTGKMAKGKWVTEFIDNDTFTLTISITQDGKEQVEIVNTYKRRK